MEFTYRVQIKWIIAYIHFMGTSASINYAVPITPKVDGESPVYRYPTFRDKLLDRPEENLFTMKDVLINSANKFAK
jgi:hypothetical protein